MITVTLQRTIEISFFGRDCALIQWAGFQNSKVVVKKLEHDLYYLL